MPPSKVIFTVIGEEKAQALKQILSEPKQPDLLPAQIVDPPDGQVMWIVDKAAACSGQPIDAVVWAGRTIRPVCLLRQHVRQFEQAQIERLVLADDLLVR